MKHLLLIFILILSSTAVFAQFEEGGLDEGAKGKPTTKTVEAPSSEVSSDEMKALETAMKDENEAQVIKAVSDILAKDPKHLIALNSLAVFHFSKNRVGLAKIIIKRALEAHAEEPVLHNNLGVIYLADGDYRKAMFEFNKALSLDDGYKPSQAQLGAIYLKYGGVEQAEEALSAGYRLVKSDLRRGSTFAASVTNNYALSLVAVGKGKKAESIFEDIIDGGSRDPAFYLNYAILLIEVLNNKEKAVKVVSKLKFLTEDRKILNKVNQLDRKLDE